MRLFLIFSEALGCMMHQSGCSTATSPRWKLSEKKIWRKKQQIDVGRSTTMFNKKHHYHINHDGACHWPNARSRANLCFHLLSYTFFRSLWRRCTRALFFCNFQSFFFLQIFIFIDEKIICKCVYLDALRGAGLRDEN